MAQLVKSLPVNAGDARDVGSIPWSRRSLEKEMIILGEENSNSLQYSCLGNHMDRGAWGLQSMRLQRVGHNCTYTPTYVMQLE